MPRQTSFENTQFDAHITGEGKETTRCRHCRDKCFVGSSSDRKGAHLKACEGFARHVAELIQKRMNGDVEARLDLKAIPDVYVAAARCAVEDSDDEGVVDESRRATIDRLFTQAMLQAGMPFHSFSNKGWKDLFKELDYTPPSRDRLSNELLTAAYDDMVKKVTRIIDSQGHGCRLNFISDESDALNKDRIMNISVNVSEGQAYHLTTCNTGSLKHDHKGLYLLLVSKIRGQVGEHGLGRWNSLCTDTCATQRAIHKELRRHPETRHVFAVLCDSHGIQLCIKDVFMDGKVIKAIPFYKEGMARAQAVSKVFRGANRLHSLLVDIAAEDGAKLRAFALSVITRWGTQFYVVDALIENKPLLEVLARRYPDVFETTEAGAEALRCIEDPRFWLQMEQLHAWLLPLHNAQIASESDRSTVGMVLPRWRDVREDLCAIDPPLPHLEELLARFDERLEKQVYDIHFAARVVDCSDPSVAIQPAEYWTRADKFFRKYSKFFDQLSYFRQRKECFADSHLWEKANKPEVFWDRVSSLALELAEMALRLLCTPANSVPSERAFSTFSFIQNSFRTKMGTHKTDQQCYVYSNSRAIIRQPWLEGQKRELKRKRQEIARSEGQVKKRLRMEHLAILTSQQEEPTAQWNMTTNAALEQQMAVSAVTPEDDVERPSQDQQVQSSQQASQPSQYQSSQQASQPSQYQPPQQSHP
ncbi:hypothetical protein D6C76_05236 [Aureobasidium pullulans]|nr:hypothetical protein D6C76_05236 [Aureobasidium pullulans]